MIRMYSINLRRDTSRRKKMELAAVQHSLPLEFVEARAGEDVDDDQFEQMGYDSKARSKAFFDLEKNEIASLLSHKKALEEFLASEDDYCIVFEDDAAITDDFSETVSQLTQHAKGWDLIKLECRTKEPKGYKIANVNHKHLIFAPLQASLGATGILYSRRGAEKVLKSLAKFRHAFDTHLGFCWKYGIYIAEIFPSVVFERKDDQSSIGGRISSKRRKNIRAWFFAKSERIAHSFRKRLFAFRTRSIIRVE